MNFWGHDWRERRNFHNQGISFGTVHHTIANYSTDTNMAKKPDLKSFEKNIFTKIHSIPDPLRKNLADTVITGNNKEKMPVTPVEEKEFYYETDIGPQFVEKMDQHPPNGQRRDFYPSFTGITSFISNVIGSISDAMFHRRPKSPVSQYYDCFDSDSHIAHEMASDSWQVANLVDQNKKRATEQSGLANDDMNNCRATVAQVENKISAVRDLLTSKTIPNVSKTPKIRQRRPKRAFIEARSVTDGYEDDPTADNYVSLTNEDYIEFIAIPNNQNQQFCDIEAPKMKTELGIVPECTDIVNTITDITPKVEIPLTVINNNEIHEETKTEVIASCEDKLAKLKAMLSEKRKKPKRSLESNNYIEEPTEENVVKPTKVIPIEEHVNRNAQNVDKSTIDTPIKETVKENFHKLVHPTKVIPKQEPVKQNSQKLDKPTNITPIEGHLKENCLKLVHPTKVIPIEKKHDKRFKNPCRLTDKRRKCKIRNNIKDDLLFANELDSEEISSVENSPVVKPTMQRIPERVPIKPKPTEKEYFDEVKGRFHSVSTDSDDSFQIVFSDSPKLSRMRRPSDCDSEDSFIVFEDSPNSCYTSNQLFDHSSDDSDSECLSDAESEVSDSGCAADICKLSHTLSRTFSDLTEVSLFDDSKPLEKTSVVEELDNDEVDCASRTIGDLRVKELSPVKEESPEPEVDSESESANRGLLIDEAKKLKRKGLPPKMVKFSEKPPKVHVMRVWSFAARQARAGHWERYSLDRERFKRRIADIDMAISWVLKPQHRSRVMFQRFMPWWNKQKRIEAAERKQREAEEKIRKEEERQKKARESVIEEEVQQEIQSIQTYDDGIVKHITDLIEAEIEGRKSKAIKDLKELLDQDKKKIARKKERERKMEAEINKNSKSTVANSEVVRLKC